MTIEEIKAKRNALAEMWGKFYYDLLCSNVPHRSESGKTFIDSAPTIIDDLIAHVERANEVAAFYTGKFSQSQEELLAVKAEIEKLRAENLQFRNAVLQMRAAIDHVQYVLPEQDRKDTARLDWLGSDYHMSTITRNLSVKDGKIAQSWECYENGTYCTLRDAIDAQVKAYGL